MGIWIALLIWITLTYLFAGNLSLKKQKKLFLIVSGMAVVLVMGSRFANPMLDGDLNNYVRLYQYARTVSLGDLFVRYDMEWGYLLMNKLLSAIFPWKQTIVFVEAIICVYFMFRFIYYYCDETYIAVLIYLAQGPFIFQLTGFRQAIAISLCLFSIDYVHKRRPFKFLTIVLLACTFHSTAIVFLSFYFIAQMKPSYKNLILYAVGFYLLIELAPELLRWGSEIVGSDYTEAVPWGSLTGPLISITIYIFSGWLFLRDSKRGRDKNFWKWNMMICGLVLYILRFISLPFERVSFYFSSSTVVTIPDKFTSIFSENSKTAAYILMAGLLAVLFFVRISSTAGMSYRFFWMT